MSEGAWLYRDNQMAPGAEIFRSGRRFLLEAYSASHGQLLLRSHEGDDGLGNHRDTTIEVLFKPVEALKIETDFRGLAIRRASVQEAEAVKQSLSTVGDHPDDRVLLLESQGATGYVISIAVGWKEGVLGHTRRSFFNEAGAYDPRWPHQTLGGVNVGFNEASVQDLINALENPTSARRERFHTVHVLMTRLDMRDGPEIAGSGVFLTEQDAEDARVQLAPKFTDCWIETLSIAL